MLRDKPILWMCFKILAELTTFMFIIIYRKYCLSIFRNQFHFLWHILMMHICHIYWALYCWNNIILLDEFFAWVLHLLCACVKYDSDNLCLKEKYNIICQPQQRIRVILSMQAQAPAINKICETRFTYLGVKALYFDFWLSIVNEALDRW